MIIDGGAPGSSICWRSRKISFTPASLITRRSNSGAAVASMGTTTPPRNRIPQQQATHSAELGPQRRTRSPGTTPRPASAQLQKLAEADRKSTRLNSSHSQISYAVFCLKKKNQHHLLMRLPSPSGELREPRAGRTVEAA